MSKTEKLLALLIKTIVWQTAHIPYLESGTYDSSDYWTTARVEDEEIMGELKAIMEES